MQPETPTQQLLEGIRGAFDRTQEQVLVWVLVVAILILIPTVIIVIFTVRARRRRLAAALHRFHEILIQRGLSVAEQALMERLERYFEHDKALLPELAHNPSYFNGAARRMREAEPETEEDLARLRFKLGLIFKNAFQAPHSTTELTPGMAVYLTLHGKTEYNAMITDVQDHGFYLRCVPGGKTGDSAAFELHSQAGVFRFTTRIKKKENDFCVFAHTEDIVQVQKRRFYRKNIQLPVTLERPKLREAAASYALDISGGGARLHNPGLSYTPGETITVVVFLGRREEAVIEARIIRLNDKDDSISVSFENMNDVLRDRLIKLAR
jgi:hypothetical protein